MTIKKLIAVFLIFALHGRAFTQGIKNDDFETVFKSDKVVLPLNYRNGANPVVEVKVNGKGPYKFMFDAGASGGARLDVRLFNEWQLPVVDSVIANEKGNTFPIVKLESIELGDFKIKGALAMVRNYNARPGGDKIDGVIGLDFFKGVLVELNFEKNQFILNKGKLDPKDKKNIHFGFDSGVPVLSIQVDNKTVDAVFDTGNMGGLILQSGDISSKIMKTEPKVIGRAKSVSGVYEIKEVQLNVPVKIGNQVFESPVVDLNDIMPRRNLGVQYIMQMNTVIDAKNQLMKLQRYQVAQPTIKVLKEFTGQYGDRTITLGEDGFLYIQRPGGEPLKLIWKHDDEFFLEKIAGALFKFVRNENKAINRIQVSRDSGASWEQSARSDKQL